MFVTKWPALDRCPAAGEWLRVQENLGLSPRTIDAYARGLTDYLTACEGSGVTPLMATRADIAGYVADLLHRPHRTGSNVVAIGSGAGLANATIQQRLAAVRLFYDFLVEEGERQSNPVGRGRYTASRGWGHRSARGLVQRFTRLPWIPTDEQWQAVLEVVRHSSIRDRTMFAFAYDAALRREELCLLRSDDLDPAHRTVRIRAETTKTRRQRVVPYSASCGVLLQAYLAHRRTLSVSRGALFLSDSRRNRGQPITSWTWSKVVRDVAARAGVNGFSTHTLRHLSLTDLARSGWELHTIAQFAGHRNTSTTLQYIHLSGRDLAAKLQASMASVHAERITSTVERLQ
jgi:site-specific recombinase XerD